METLIGLALKSLLIAGATLLLLRLTRSRSSAERSLIAHLGLLAMVALPFASLALPALQVTRPGMFAAAPAPLAAPIGLPTTTSDPAPLATEPAIAPAVTEPGIDWTPYAYAVPAIALLLVTLIALLRLFALRSRAQVLVDPRWLSALAHAQRRMGFKHGTALLTSSELNSPISWGLMRPVILLNDEALTAGDEAEAIIAHELAHVARLDWAKLMLARVATAIFWFNPLAWVLAREAHQLREETADDAVLAADIAGTDYAQLLVGFARHECRGTLLGAHGVAPSKDSLRRRVRRVLDGSLARGPAARSWTAGFAAGMLVMAAPLAALTFAPDGTPQDKLDDEDVRLADQAALADPDAIAATVAANVGRNVSRQVAQNVPAAVAASAAAALASHDPETVMTGPNGATITVYPPDAKGRQAVVMRQPNGSTVRFADSRAMHPHLAQRLRNEEEDEALDAAIAMKALNVTPQYVAAIRRAAPHVKFANDDFIELRAVGASAASIADLARAGYPRLDKGELVEAHALGIDGNYIRALAKAGKRNLSMDQLTEYRALGFVVQGGKGLKIKFPETGGPDIDIDVDPEPHPHPEPHPDE